MNRFFLYDYLQVSGGAERLALSFVDEFADFQMVVSRVYPEAVPLLDSFPLSSQNLMAIGSPLTKCLPRVAEALLVFSLRSEILREADTVIYSGFYAPLAVRYQLRGKKLFYCHTPPRFAYDRKAATLHRMPDAMRPLVGKMIDTYRCRFESAIGTMDRVLTNSENVRARIQRDLGIDSIVVYPPIDTQRFKWIGAGDYFISLARLTSQKRVAAIIRAFLAMPHEKLVVASGGMQEAHLRQLARGAANIQFTGWLSESDLCRLVGSSRAAIYVPHDEDFGMSPVEAMAAGKPVIGVAEGGMLETVVNGETGRLVAPELQIEDIVEAVGWLTRERATMLRRACELRAEMFSKQRFADTMRRHLYW